MFMKHRSFSCCLFVEILVLINSGVLAFSGEWGPDLEGPWCASRPRGKDCCFGRDDYCSVPILGTECYCDIFCNDTASDCCPDYRQHCHGYSEPTTTPRPTTLPPPRPTRDTLAPCFKDNVYFRPGDTIQDNCNNCTCDLYQVPTRRYDWRCSRNICLLRPELIKAVNDNPRYFWSASNYSNFWGQTLEDGVRHRLGTFQLSDNVVDMTPIRVEDDVLPESFDSRVKWPNILHPISDQGNCASSWAHSSVAVASDRLNIETEGVIKEKMSVQHLLSCDTDGQLGCNGGHLDRAWWFLRQKGVVSEECYPYTSGRTGTKGVCLITGRTEDRCPSGIQYRTEKRYQATPPYRIRPFEREIMKEIADNGPVQAIMQVREDFFMYRSGVYKYTGLTSQRNDPEDHMMSGFHSVRIMGWGAERTHQGDIIKFWICANSWGTDWGENGYFRIVRGSDESSIESSVIGVWGKITGDQDLRDLLNENRRRRLRVERARKRRHLRQLGIRGKHGHNEESRKQHSPGVHKITSKIKANAIGDREFINNGDRSMNRQGDLINHNIYHKHKKHNFHKKHNMQHKHKKHNLQQKYTHNEPRIHSQHGGNTHTKLASFLKKKKKEETDLSDDKYLRNIVDKIIYDV